MPRDQSFDSNGVEIVYDDVGEGEPIVLVHGFASDRRGNWEEPGWYDALVEAGRRVIALDNRGHGESGTPHDASAYANDEMPDDVVRLMDHHGIETADLMGYSMGARISMNLLVDHPERFEAVILAGAGDRNLHGDADEDDDRGGFAAAFEADDPAEIDDPRARGFREFAEENDNDIDALAAYQRAPRTTLTAEDLDQVSLPVLVVNGSEDDVGDPQDVADTMPTAEAAVIPDRDHLTAVGDPRYKAEVFDFLDREGLAS